jgi:hypothetical protein
MNTLTELKNQFLGALNQSHIALANRDLKNEFAFNKLAKYVNDLENQLTFKNLPRKAEALKYNLEETKIMTKMMKNEWDNNKLLWLKPGVSLDSMTGGSGVSTLQDRPKVVSTPDNPFGLPESQLKKSPARKINEPEQSSTSKAPAETTEGHIKLKDIKGGPGDIKFEEVPKVFGFSP